MVNSNLIKIFTPAVLFFCILLFSQCSNSRNLTAGEKYPFEILFGNTGGFTNLNPVFTVNHKGEVFKKDNPTAASYSLKKLNKHEVETIYKLLKTCKFEELKISQVSNFTHYIEVKSEKITNRIQWFNDSQISDEVKKLNEFLISTVTK